MGFCLTFQVTMRTLRPGDDDELPTSTQSRRRNRRRSASPGSIGVDPPTWATFLASLSARFSAAAASCAGVRLGALDMASWIENGVGKGKAEPRICPRDTDLPWA